MLLSFFCFCIIFVSVKAIEIDEASAKNGWKRRPMKNSLSKDKTWRAFPSLDPVLTGIFSK